MARTRARLLVVAACFAASPALGQSETTGIVEVKAGKLNGKVFADGREVGTITDGHAELTLPTGLHQITVRAKGFEDTTGKVTVHAGGSAELALEPSESLDEPAERAAPAEQGGSSTKKIVGWTAVGAGGALTLVGGYAFYLAHQDTNDPAVSDYASRYLPKNESDVCAYARSHPANADAALAKCDDNEAHKRMALILTPIGLVLVGTGVYLLLTSGPDKPAAAHRSAHPPRVTPFVGLGPRGGAIQVNVAF